MKIPDIAWPTFFDSYRESMLNAITVNNVKERNYDVAHGVETRKRNAILCIF